MRVLTLRPGYRALGYALFADHHSPSAVGGTIALPPARELEEGLDGALSQILQERAPSLSPPELTVIHCAHDGGAFTGPTLVTRESLAALRRAAGAAPLHVPPALRAAEAVSRALPTVPALFVFETSLFAALPARERLYALDRDTRSALRAVRSGYHGLYHAEAADTAARTRQSLGKRGPARVASVCLEPKPEVAALLGYRPMLVTSGATPLEGLPGEHVSGETDPGIVLALARSKALGPDELNELFTRSCGLSALLERDATLGEVLTSTDESTRLAREVFAHRLLLACGAAAAALGGLDTLVFSGRYARAGAAVQGPILQKLALALASEGHGIDVLTVEHSLDRILAQVGVDGWRRSARRGPERSLGVTL